MVPFQNSSKISIPCRILVAMATKRKTNKQFFHDKNYWPYLKIYSTKKLRKSQKTMEQKNTKVNNYSISIYSFRYISSVEKSASSSLLALIPLLCTVSSNLGVKVFFRKKKSTEYSLF